MNPKFHICIYLGEIHLVLFALASLAQKGGEVVRFLGFARKMNHIPLLASEASSD
jgi:hypothetical protein